MAKSTKSSENPAKGVKWDLSDLYTSIDDPQIEKDKKKIVRMVEKFSKNNIGKIKSKKTNANNLSSSIKEFEIILDKLFKVSLYGYLLHSQDMNNHKIGLFYSQISEFSTEINSKLLWFTNEIKQIPTSKLQKMTQKSELKQYQHFINELIKFKPFTLSTKEEVIIAKKSLTSSNAFINFYDKTIGEERFELKVGTKNKQLTISEIAPILKSNPDRKIRKRAADSYTHIFEKHKSFYTFTLNNLLLDSKINDEIRGYKFPQQSTFLNYEVSPEMVDAMVKSVQSNVNIVERYYKIKKRIVGLKKLEEIDRYSPLFPQNNKRYSWNEAKDMVLTAFSKISPKMSTIATKYFENNWIDAELKPHKQNGAFCYHGSKSTVPYVLVNYSGDLNDVTTLAHELGHAIHGYLYRQNNSFLEMHAPTTVAEIASIFSESLTFDLLMDNVHDDKTKLNYLAEKIEGMFASVFRQTEFYLFEVDIHSHRRERGELSPEEFSNYFQKRLQHMFGDSLTLSEGHKWWWMPIMHFYHFNFYVFAYAFGELLSLALYANYKQQGKRFVDNYIEALKAGGSKSPAEITAMMGIDITNPKFWDKGLELLDGYVDEFEQLARLAGAPSKRTVTV